MTDPTYRIEIARRAERDLLALPSSIARRIVLRIDVLARDPRPRGARKLSGEDEIYRLRVGQYRVLYEIQDRVLLILVVAIGHRREVYRG